MNFSRLLPFTCSALLLSVLACSAHAQTQAAASDAPLQQRAQARTQARADIAQAREEIRARQQAAEKDCWQRFAVESCLTTVRKAAREEEQPLRDRELALNNEERKEKADERLRTIEQKQREKQVPAPVVMRARDGAADEAMIKERASDAQQRAEAQARRQQAHEAEVAQKQAKQEAKRRKALQNQQAKQAAAKTHSESKSKAIEGRKGALLPIPAELPQP